MKSLLYSVLFCMLIISCAKPKEATFDSSGQFTDELAQLQDYFHIPGMAVAVVQNDQFVYENYFGFADINTKAKLNRQSLFPIASVTKTFSGVILMKLVEEGKLSLEDPINNFLSEPVFDDGVLVKHILSHTSQGDIGKQFYYSFRFGVLTKVIEKAAGKPFDSVMQQHIFEPLNLQHTFLLKDNAQVAQKNVKLVQPYILEEGTNPGFIDYGYSTSAGIVSNVEDLITFSNALDDNVLISEASKNNMISPLQTNLPYGYGIFKQQFLDTDIVWSYGQYDCYASLFLKIPSKDITLIILANNNLMSDAARLINGDVTSSLFALSFLKNYVLEDTSLLLFEPKESDETVAKHSEFYQRKLLAEALAESFMARFDVEKLQHSLQLLEKAFTHNTDYLSYADINLLHTLTFIKDVAFYRDLEEINQFDAHIEAIANKLISEEANNPYANYYIANFYDRKGDLEKARLHFEAIVNATNFSKWWYTAEAKNWLKTHPKPE